MHAVQHFRCNAKKKKKEKEEKKNTLSYPDVPC